MEYTPFIDKKGKKISLEKLRIKDILGIQENGIEEGYQVEFKSQWDENFKKKHLCQTIASFANAEGGWLLVGIEDNTGKYIGIDKQRADFSQTISQKLVSVTPMPKFECRYIHETNNRKRGVLVIKVYEGLNPPYICNGIVYTRSGSSKIPIRSDRSSIDELFHKREKAEEKLKAFCVNKFVNEKTNFPYCTVYLYNPYNDIDYSIYEKQICRIKTEMKTSEIRGRIVDSVDSVIRMGSDVISVSSKTCMEEYFADGNIKIYSPLFVLDERAIHNWSATVAVYNESVNMDGMIIVDGMVTYLTLFGVLKAAFTYIKNIGKKISDYRIIFEYKNVSNVVFYHRHNFNKSGAKERFIQDIQAGKIYVCQLNDIMTKPITFRTDDNEGEVDGYAGALLDMFYLRLFGIDGDTFEEILEKSEGRYEDKVFSSETYQG